MFQSNASQQENNHLLLQVVTSFSALTSSGLFFSSYFFVLSFFFIASRLTLPIKYSKFHGLRVKNYQSTKATQGEVDGYSASCRENLLVTVIKQNAVNYDK